MTAMWEVVREHGIPESFYTDRAGWAFETPKAGGKVSKTHLTQVGEALARLGIEHIPSYSPQARGRSERMNRTLQDRLVNELKAAGITSAEAANDYLRERYLPTHNEEFAREPADPQTAFVELGDVDLDEIFFEEVVRKVGKDNTVGFDGVLLQIEKQAGRRTCAGLTVQVRRHLDGGYTVRRGAQLLGAYDAEGRPRPVRPRADAPGCLRIDASGPGRLPGRPRHQQLQALGEGGRRRSAGLWSPPAPSGRHSLLSAGIEGIAKADRSLVKTDRTQEGRSSLPEDLRPRYGQPVR